MLGKREIEKRKRGEEMMCKRQLQREDERMVKQETETNIKHLLNSEAVNAQLSAMVKHKLLIWDKDIFAKLPSQTQH